MKDPKIIGHLNGEPVFEVAELPEGTSIFRNISGSESDREHRTNCLPCLFNSLIDPVEELEQFMVNAHARIRAIEAAPKESGEHGLRLHDERNRLVTEMALATYSIADLKSLIVTASKFL